MNSCKRLVRKGVRQMIGGCCAQAVIPPDGGEFRLTLVHQFTGDEQDSHLFCGDDFPDLVQSLGAVLDHSAVHTGQTHAQIHIRLIAQNKEFHLCTCFFQDKRGIKAC